MPPIVCLAIALLAALSATDLVRLAAVRLGAVDRSGGRRLHGAPTPRLGGLAIFWGFALALLVAGYSGMARGSGTDALDAGFLGLLAGAGIMLLLGQLDDVYGLRAVFKLVVQCAAANVLWLSGWRIEAIGLPGLGTWQTGAWSLPLTVGWIVYVTNALNLIDGLDGLAGGIALVTCCAVGGLLFPLGAPELLVIAALAGALLGFLRFNVHPARIFMGDAGSLFVGFVLAAIMVRAGQVSRGVIFPLVPALLFAVPMWDASYAVVRRTLGARRETRSEPRPLRAALARMVAADRGHVHHVLIQAGFSTRGAVAVLLAAAGSLALSGCVSVHDQAVGLPLSIDLLALWTAGFWMVRRRQPVPSIATPVMSAPAAREHSPAERADPESDGSERAAA